MPPPKAVKRLEKIRAKGAEVEYPSAPWFTDHKEQIEQESVERQRRINEAPNADLLPEFPANRSEGVGAGRQRTHRKPLFKTFRYA